MLAGLCLVLITLTGPALLASLGGCGTGETPALPAVLLCSAPGSLSLAESQLSLLPDRLFLSKSPQFLKTDDLGKNINPFSFTEEQKWWIQPGIKSTTYTTEPQQEQN